MTEPLVSEVCIATDDPAVASALKEARGEWSLSVATDPRSVQALLEVGTAGVAVFDRRSTWVDDDLLRLVRDVSPETVRVALLPDPSVVDAVRVSRLAHQVLPSETSASAIASACERALNVRSVVSDPRVRAVIAEAPELAAPPELWTTLNALLDDPDASANDIANVVASDPVSAAHVLRLANSAFFGLSRHVVQLRDAVSLIGLTTIRALVLESAAARSVPATSVHLERGRMQQHALATARVARAIAGEGRAADAFLSGLLMDVGTLVLASARPETTELCLAKAARDRAPLYRVEDEELGFSHASVGAALLGMWGLPYSVLDAVAHHHERPDLAGGLTVREALFLARDATQTCGAIDPYDDAGPLVPDADMAADMSLELLVHSARSVASDLDPSDV